MVNLLRHPVAAFILMGVLISLMVTTYVGFEDYYGVEDSDTRLHEGEQLNIMERLKSLHLIAGVNSISIAIAEINAPNAGIIDIIGALASVGIGVLKSVFGIISLPFQIVSIIMDYYHIPAAVQVGIGSIFIVYIGFIILSAYLRSDV